MEFTIKNISRIFCILKSDSLFHSVISSGSSSIVREISLVILSSLFELEHRRHKVPKNSLFNGVIESLYCPAIINGIVCPCSSSSIETIRGQIEIRTNN